MTGRLQNRRNVAVLSVFRRYVLDSNYPISTNIIVANPPGKSTRRAGSRHSKHLEQLKFRTSLYELSFISATIKLWNSLPQEAINSVTIPQKFKEAVNQLLPPNY